MTPVVIFNCLDAVWAIGGAVKQSVRVQPRPQPDAPPEPGPVTGDKYVVFGAERGLVPPDDLSHAPNLRATHPTRLLLP